MASWGGAGKPLLSLAASACLPGNPVIAANIALAMSPTVFVVIAISLWMGSIACHTALPER